MRYDNFHFKAPNEIKSDSKLLLETEAVAFLDYSISSNSSRLSLFCEGWRQSSHRFRGITYARRWQSRRNSRRMSRSVCAEQFCHFNSQKWKLSASQVALRRWQMIRRITSGGVPRRLSTALQLHESSWKLETEYLGTQAFYKLIRNWISWKCDCLLGFQYKRAL